MSISHCISAPDLSIWNSSHLADSFLSFIQPGSIIPIDWCDRLFSSTHFDKDLWVDDWWIGD